MEILEWISEILDGFWQIRVQVAPTIIAIFILEAAGIVREYTKVPYVPVYFALFPLNILNKDVAIYLNDDSCVYSTDQTDAELELLRSKIIQKVAISFALSLGLIPFAGGLIVSLFLPTSSLLGLLLIYAAYKLIGIIRAGLEFKDHAISNVKTMTLFCLIYLFYFLVFFRLFVTTFNWGRAFVEVNDWLGLMVGVFDQVLVTFLFGTVIVGAIGTFLVNSIATPANRLLYARELNDEIGEE